MRIAVTGSAGTGKTTLVEALAERLDVPVVPEGMREYLERTGVDLHDLAPFELRELVETLWGQRLEQEAVGPFVADRCSVDFAAFWLLYRFHHQPGVDTDAWMAAFRERARIYDRIVLLPHGAFDLERDGIRSPNQWIQLHFQIVLEGLLGRWGLGDRVLSVPPGCVSGRFEWVLERLGRAGSVASSGPAARDCLIRGVASVTVPCC